MAVLSRDEKELLRQANRRLTNMQKVSNDKNVQNAVKFAQRDISLASAGKQSKYKVTSSMTERQKKAMINSATKIMDSPYSTVKGREKFYRERTKQFAKTFGVTTRQAKQLQDTLFEQNNPTGKAWLKIQSEPIYQGTSKAISNSIGEIVSNIGNQKFGLMMRLYIEASLQDDYEQGFIGFLEDKEIRSFFENNSLDTISDFVNNKMWE